MSTNEPGAGAGAPASPGNWTTVPNGTSTPAGVLDPAILAQMPTLTFGAQIEWTPESGLMKTISSTRKADCTTYRCLLDPQSCP